MAPEAVRRVVDVWADQTAELGAEYRWVQVFENRGEAMGASNPHPHGQIWAGTALPGRGGPRGRRAARPPARDRPAAAARLRRSASRAGQRVVVETDEWLAVVPFWAAWPFETLLVPEAAGGAPARPRRRRRATSSPAVLHDLLGRYDGLFRRPFPYSMGWHQAPFGDGVDRPLAGPRPLLPAAPARPTSASSWSATSCSPSPSAT